MKDNIIQIIKIMGLGLNELVVDIELNDGTIINSIEWIPNGDKLYLHVIIADLDNLDIEIDFENASLENQEVIFNKLSQIIYN